MIRFIKIDIEGFLSIGGPFSYKLDNPGITIISGKNGAGKSSILNALTWALYGELIGKLDPQTWEDARPESYKGTKVSVTFEKAGRVYEIIRMQEYRGKVQGSTGKNRLVCLIDGNPYQKITDKRKLGKQIQEWIGASFPVFTNSILLGQNITRLLDEKTEKQKQILEEACGASYIKLARDLAMKDLEKVELSVASLRASEDELKNLIEGKKQHLQDLKRVTDEARKNREKEIKSQVEELEQELSETTQELSNLQEKISEKRRDQVEAELDRHSNLIETTENLLDSLYRWELEYDSVVSEESDLNMKLSQFIKTGFRELMKNRECPTCGTPLSKAKIQEHFQKEKETLSLKLDKIKTKKEKIEKTKPGDREALEEGLLELKHDKRILGLKSEKNEIAAKMAAISILNSQKKTIISKISRLSQDLQEILNSSPNRVKLRELKLKIEDLELERDNLGNKRAKAEKEVILLRWLVKEPLSNKGLKNFLFNAFLSEVSKRSRYYEAFSGFRVELSIDSSKANKPLASTVWHKKKQRPYGDLSGGQRQLSNLGVAVAIHDELSKNNPFNILFMDEVFESLDNENIQLVSEMISQIAQVKEGKSIHLITHHLGFISSNTHSVHLKLVNKLTQVEYTT